MYNKRQNELVAEDNNATSEFSQLAGFQNQVSR
jgi:hypothetical protein